MYKQLCLNALVNLNIIIIIENVLVKELFFFKFKFFLIVTFDESRMVPNVT